jgi:hypothetical protein
MHFRPWVIIAVTPGGREPGRQRDSVSQGQLIDSRIIAVPWPPPMHMVTSP